MRLLPETHQKVGSILDVRIVQEQQPHRFPPPTVTVDFRSHRHPETRHFSFVLLGIFLVSIILILSFYAYAPTNGYNDPLYDFTTTEGSEISTHDPTTVEGLPTRDPWSEITDVPTPNTEEATYGNTSPPPSSTDSDTEEASAGSSLEPGSSACPHCTPATQSTTRQLDPVVDNPVSFINNKHQTETTYSKYEKCNDPPHYRIILKIDLHNGSWEGTGEEKPDAKKHAAYKAMEDLYPNDLDEVMCWPIHCSVMPDWECVSNKLDF